MIESKINSGDICKRCGKNSILTDDTIGERFCGKCGFVISEMSQDSEDLNGAHFKKKTV